MQLNVKMGLQRYGTVLALLALIVFFSVATGAFIEPRNLIDILAHISMLTIIATGLTICMVTGDFDMSIASVAGLSGVLVASLVLKGFPLGIALLLVVLLGAVFGLVGGVLITKVKVSAFIATLALGSVAQGINYMYTRGQEVFGEFKPDFLYIGQGRVLGIIPTQVLVMLAVVLLFAFIMERTKAGRWMYAIGGSIRAAYNSGIRVDLYRVMGLVLSGALAAFTGCVLASRLGSGQPTAGDAFLLDAIAAAYIGMTTLRVSRPNIKVLDTHFLPPAGFVEDAQSAMQAYLVKYGKQINAVWCAWDDPAYGVSLAIKDKGFTQKDMFVVGIDGNTRNVQLIKSGQSAIAATIVQPFDDSTAKAAELIKQIVVKKRSPQEVIGDVKVIYMSTPLVTSANAADYLK